MAATQNGTPLKVANGHVKGQPNGHLIPKSSAQKKRAAKNTSTSILSTATRLVVWYVLLTAIFRCPTNEKDLTDKSPQICKPVLIATSHVKPYVQPYYDTYAAPYVDVARPYADKLNRQVITPATRISKKSYNLYAAPRIEQAKEYGLAQWNAVAVPQLQAVQLKANEAYAQNLAPHVQTLTAAVEPHYTALKENAGYVHKKHILPAIEFSKPYVEKSIAVSQQFAVDTAIPMSKSAWSSIVLFVDGTLVPTMRSLYRENVEPQLFLIGERLAAYREGRKLTAVVEEVDTTSVAPEPTETTATEQVIESTVEPVAEPLTEEPVPEPTPLTSEEMIAAAREQVTSDLRSWQEKFALAADKGSDDLAQRIGAIMTDLINSEVEGVAVGLVKALNISGEKEIANVKSKILSVVEGIPEDADSTAEEAAESEIFAAIRSAGASVKTYAQKLRQWYNTFDSTLFERASIASESTLNVLDNIRDLGLQEIGMRWAWMDGITYHDWEKYHQMKQQFDEWRTEVTDVAFKHEQLEKAKAAANTIVAEGMTTAEKVAAELARLKEVGKWKVYAHDASDDFETKTIPPSAVRVKKSVAEAIESVTEVLEGTSEATTEPILSQASEVVEDAASSISSAVVPEETPEIISEASSIASEAASSATEAVESVSSSISSTLSDETDEPVSAESSPLAEAAEDAGKSDTTTASSIIPGAMAQEVTGSQVPILDDIIEDDEQEAFSEKIGSIVEAASDRYAEVTKAVSEALLGATPTPGSAESIASLASEQYSSAIDAASRALYGTPTGKAESIASQASDRYREAVSAASSIIYGTPTPISASVVSQASSLYSEAVSRAKEQYDHAISIASVQISGTPQPVHEQIFSSIDSAYSGSLAAASDKLQAAVDAAQSQYSSASSVVGNVFATPSQGILAAISEAASSRLDEALSQASAQYSSVKSAVGPTPTPVHQQYINEAQRRYYEAIGLAHERYSEFVGAASSAVYGTPTGTFEAATSLAADNWQSLVSKASEQIYGQPTPFVESVASQANEYAATVTDAAAAQYEAVQSYVSELIIGKEPEFTESVMNQLSAAFHTGYHASLASSASSYASEAYESASSVVVSVFTPPPTLEAIISSANAQIGSAVDALSEQVYGTPKGTYEQATSAAAESYSSLSAQVSEAIYGHQTGYVEAAQSSISAAVSNAQIAVSEAIYGTSTGPYESATSVAASVYTSIASVAGDNAAAVTEAAGSYYSQASAAASSAIYGPEQGAVESVQSRLSVAAESAQSRLAELVAKATDGATEVYEAASSSIEEFASSISSAASSASSKVRDEL